MGGLVLGIDLITPPADEAALDALHHDVWDIVAGRIARFVDGWPAAEEIVANYLYFQESDGFDDGSWFANGARLVDTFGDAAGLCHVEMEACEHWASLVVLDRWDALTAAAAVHGAELALPGGPVPAEDQLRAIVTGRADQVFFHHYTDDEHERMGLASTADAPGDDHELRFYGIDEGAWPLSRTGDDRERITELITAGRCACGVCQNVRYFRDLPTARSQFG